MTDEIQRAPRQGKRKVLRSTKSLGKKWAETGSDSQEENQ